ncbi:ABC transporter substrate-binding protein [Paenibacillus sp. tmac-D7]|uniref:ABC transporter substrate-binding protein n=1 Tax=Paenibacillus sp. tmac-D7 TaxID=2591462 RepID=UPI0011414BE2|nr:sugar ABC transporter substrate-binding protein [Paenibacillus sp. tmac-D7]
MKKIVSVLLIAMLAFTAIAGCSSGNQPVPEAKTPDNTGSDKQAKTEITIMVLGEWLKDLQVLVGKFEEANPDIKVSVVSLPFRQLFEGIEVQMNSKKPTFDLFTVDGPLVANYTAKGFLEPLDSYITAEQKGKLIDSSVQLGTFNGKFMASPLNTSSQLLYYNKDILTAKGVTPPSSDPKERWTWEKLVEEGKKLTYDSNGDGQTDVFGFSFQQIGRPYQVLPLAHSLGAKVISDNGIQASGFTNSPEMVQASKFYFDLFNTWKISPKISPDVSIDYFATGKVAMFVGGTALLKQLQDKGLSFGYAPIPYFDGQKPATPTGSWHLGISQFSTKKEAAAKFIQYATVGEGSKVWFEQRNEIPANKELLDAIDKEAKFNEFPASGLRLAAYEAKNTSVSRPSTPGYLEWESLLNKAYEI